MSSELSFSDFPMAIFSLYPLMAAAEERASAHVSFLRAHVPFMRVPYLITRQRPHLPVPSYWELGLQYINLGLEDTNFQSITNSVDRLVTVLGKSTFPSKKNGHTHASLYLELF